MPGIQLQLFTTYGGTLIGSTTSMSDGTYLLPTTQAVDPNWYLRTAAQSGYIAWAYFVKDLTAATAACVVSGLDFQLVRPVANLTIGGLSPCGPGDPPCRVRSGAVAQWAPLSGASYYCIVLRSLFGFDNALRGTPCDANGFYVQAGTATSFVLPAVPTGPYSFDVIAVVAADRTRVPAGPLTVGSSFVLFNID